MIQEVLVGLIFAGAVAYVGRILYKQLQPNASCATGCGKCSVIDFKKIEADLKSKGV